MDRFLLATPRRVLATTILTVGVPGLVTLLMAKQLVATLTMTQALTSGVIAMVLAIIGQLFYGVLRSLVWQLVLILYALLVMAVYRRWWTIAWGICISAGVLMAVTAYREHKYRLRTPPTTR